MMLLWQLRVNRSDLRDPDAGEHVNESSLQRSVKMAGQGVDAPTTTINTGTMSIVTIQVRLSLLANLQITEISSGHQIHQQSSSTFRRASFPGHFFSDTRLDHGSRKYLQIFGL